jgi:hypothetical protein
MLVGSADKRPLTGELLREFGSNAGLAQARARLIRTSLIEDLKMDPGKVAILSVYAGPENVGASVTFQQMALDRSVQVCALWGAPSAATSVNSPH